MLLSQTLQDLEAPKAATASRSVLAGIMSTPGTMRRFKVGAADGLLAGGCWPAHSGGDGQQTGS